MRNEIYTYTKLLICGTTINVDMHMLGKSLIFQCTQKAITDCIISLKPKIFKMLKRFFENETIYELA